METIWPWIVIGVLLVFGLISFVLKIDHLIEKVIRGEDPEEDNY